MSQDSVEGTDVDEDVVALDLHGVDGDGRGGRQAGRLAGAQVEARAVQPALDRAVLDLALGSETLAWEQMSLIA